MRNANLFGLRAVQYSTGCEQNAVLQVVVYLSPNSVRGGGLG